MCIYIYDNIPVVPARGGAEVALKIYIRPFSSIKLACAVRKPSPCVRALCETGVLFHMSHLKLHFTLHTWQSSHSTLHTSHCTLRSQYFTLHSPHFTLHTPHFTLHTPHFTLHTPHFILHTPHFTLHSSCPTLHTAPFISSELFSPYSSSSLLISSLLICQQSFHESLPSTTTKELACAVRQQGPCVRALCETGVLFHMSHCSTSHFALDSLHTPHYTLHTALFTLHSSHFTLHTLHTSHCTLRTPHFTLHTSQSTLHTALFALQTSHFTVHTSHFTVHTSHFSLLTASFTLQTSHCILHAPHFTLHSSHPTLHLIWALLTLSQLSSSHLISSHMSSQLSWITSQYYYKGTCMRSAPARPVRACFVRSCCNVVLRNAAAAPSNLDAGIPMRSAATELQNTIELRATASETATPKPESLSAHNNTKWQQSCSHSNAICHHSFKKRIELRTQEQPLVAKHIGGTIRDRNDRSRNRRTDEVPFLAGCSRFTRKNTRFRAPASSPTQSPCNIMQPFQCDLPPQLQETHRTTHTGTTTRCKTHRRNNSRQKRPQPHPPHRRGTFHRRLQPLYTEKHKVSCSGFLPTT